MPKFQRSHPENICRNKSRQTQPTSIDSLGDFSHIRHATKNPNNTHSHFCVPSSSSHEAFTREWHLAQIPTEAVTSPLLFHSSMPLCNPIMNLLPLAICSMQPSVIAFNEKSSCSIHRLTADKSTSWSTELLKHSLP
eukprot:c22005_g1_i1 orf=374-784(+)